MKNMTESQQLLIEQTLSQAEKAMKQGNTAIALQFFNTVLQHQPNHPVAIKGLRKLQQETTHNSSVQVEIVDPSPDQINILVNLYYTGQMVQTEQACKGLLQTYPQSLVVINLLGASLQGQGKLQEAVESFDKVIQLKPDYAAAYNNRGAVLKELGQLEVAVENYHQAIQLQPDYTDAYYNLGIALQELEQLVEALESFNKAIQLKPDYTEAYNNRGNVLKELGQLDQAVKNYDKAIQLNPDYAKAYTHRGNVLKELGLLNKALGDYDHVIQLQPDSIEAYNDRGNVLKALGQSDKAAACYDRAIHLKSGYFAAYNNRGNALKDLGKLKEAVECYNKAIQLKPDCADGYCNRGLALQQLGQLVEAIENYDKAIQLKLDFAEAYFNRGSALLELEQFSESKESTDRAIQLKPYYAEAYCNLGSILKELGQLTEAVDQYDLAIQFKPEYADAYYNRGIVFECLGQLAEALENYALAIQFKPDYFAAIWNLSLLQLNNGFLSEGFKNYEARWEWDDFPSSRRRFSISRWNGESLQGKNILLWAEQGIGDQIVYASLIPEFKDLGCNVGIECAAKLVDVFQWSFPWADVRETGMINCEEIEIYSQFDYQIPMGSLAPQFRKTLDDFRTYQKPFIPRLKEGEIKVRNKLNLEDGQLLIGLCWRSSYQTKTRSVHYLTVEDLAPLKAIKNAVFLGLQYDDCLPELDRVRDLGLPIHYYTDIDQKNDLASSCALMGACDLVISPGTAVAELSASLGVPTIKFLYTKIKGSKLIPWHPTMQTLEFSNDNLALLATQIIQDMDELVDWANAVTTSGRCIDSYTGEL
jgi:tetratricopeptide (TPR) repeat protein